MPRGAFILLLGACGGDPVAPSADRLQQVAMLWADDEPSGPCWSLVQCYRGLSPAEAMAVQMQVQGGFSQGLSAEDREVCEIIQSHLLWQKDRGELGIWTQPEPFNPAITDLSTRRIGLSQGYIHDKFVIYHEGFHSATGLGDNVMIHGMKAANYFGLLCSRGYL